MDKIFEYLHKKYPDDDRFEKCMNGIFPKNIIIDGNYIVRLGKKKLEEHIDDDIKTSAKRIKAFFDEIPNKTKKTIDMTDWTSIKRRKVTKKAIISEFVSRIREKKDITYEKSLEFQSLIYIGLFIKYIKDEDIKMDGCHIKKIKGIGIKDGEVYHKW